MSGRLNKFADDRAAHAAELTPADAILADRIAAALPIGFGGTGGDRQLVPLSALALDPGNVRRTEPRAGLEALAADLYAHGQLQNLVVIENIDAAETWLVKAGGRRYRALKLLERDGKIAADHPVAVNVLALARSAEASLAENLQRLHLNPADEIAAFGALVADGETPAAIASRFGLTERHVEGRLRLSGLAEPVMTALRTGEISLDQAKAFASTSDAELQASVFKKHGGNRWEMSPDAIRRHMAQSSLAGDDPVALLLTREAYLAAGGRIDRDLFSDDDSEAWLDRALAEKLATAILQTAAPVWRDKFGFGKVIAVLNRPTIDDTAGHAHAGHHQDWTQLPAGQRAQLVVAIWPDDEGKVAVYHDRAWLLRGDTLQKDAPPPAARDEAHPDDASEIRPDRQSPAEPVPPAPEVEVTSLSQRLLDELAMAKRDALAWVLADWTNAATAYQLMLFSAAEHQLLSHRASRACALAITNLDEPIGGSTPDTPLDAALVGTRSQLDMTWSELPTAPDRFDAFVALPLEQAHRWACWIAGESLRAWGANYNRTTDPLTDHLGQLLKVDASVHWRPVAANYWDRVPKNVCLDFILEVEGAVAAKVWKAKKKPEIAAHCEALALGKSEFDNVDVSAVRAWLPVQMRFGA